MDIRQIALDKDVRATRLLPTRQRFASVHFLRRALGVLVLIGIDVGALALALLLASVVSHTALFDLWPGLTHWGVMAAAAGVVVIAALLGLYGPRGTRHSMRKVANAWTVGFVIASVLLLLIDPNALGARLVAVFLVAALISATGRWTFDTLLSLRNGRHADGPRTLVLGDLAACTKVLPTLRTLPPQHRLNVVGLVVPEGREAEAAATHDLPPLVGTMDELAGLLARCGADEVVIADLAALNGQLRPVIEACREAGVGLRLAPPQPTTQSAALGYVPGLDVTVFIVQRPPAHWASYLTKRLVDRLGAVLLLVVLSPLLLLIAVLVKLGSHGPVLYVGVRVGVGQRPFRFYKFRTMSADAPARQTELESCNEAGDVLFKMKDDPRVTRMGGLLRRSSLDELPQLFNVVKGDMSLIGPRPLPLRDCELMEAWHRRRHVVLPGITGLWQVSGRSALGFAEMIALDERYIETWSLGTDLQIALRTVLVVVHLRGAY